MSDHKCYIGMRYDYENTDLVTLEDLMKTVSDNEELVKHYPGLPYMLWKSYLLSDYLDRRKSTDLYRFRFCPECGKSIDWRYLRTEGSV